MPAISDTKVHFPSSKQHATEGTNILAAAVTISMESDTFASWQGKQQSETPVTFLVLKHSVYWCHLAKPQQPRIFSIGNTRSCWINTPSLAPNGVDDKVRCLLSIAYTFIKATLGSRGAPIHRPARMVDAIFVGGNVHSPPRWSDAVSEHGQTSPQPVMEAPKAKNNTPVSFSKTYVCTKRALWPGGRVVGEGSIASSKHTECLTTAEHLESSLVCGRRTVNTWICRAGV